MADEGPSAFGVLLRQLRLAAGLSQEALAERARTSAVTIGALERGVRRAPYRETVALLAEALALRPPERSKLEAAAVRPQRHKGVAAALPRAAGNLPLALTHFVGRQTELADLEELVGAERMVTIAGAGGIGKTRTALEVAAAASASAGNGAWFVDLAPLTDPALVASAVASALGLAEQSDRPVLETVLQHLAGRRALLVFDNCEHVIDAAARVAEALLAACPGVRVLATSREPLRIGGERVYRLPPLPFPPPGGTLDARDALQYAAVTLFADRASAADASFRLSDESAAAVAEICRRLDGIALAIELAAARVNVVEPRRLATLLDERFRVLEGGKRTALPRQRTMWALIDWSYDLLSDEEKRLFRRLSVFGGGWTPAAAADVCGDPAVEVLLWGLVDKSLVAAEPAGDDDERYRFLESTREYARRQAEMNGETEALSRAHAEWCLRFVEHAKSALETMPEMQWFALVDAELDNIRTALDWCLRKAHAPEMGAAIAAALGEYWPPRQRREGRTWLELAEAALAAKAAANEERDAGLAAAVLLAHAATLPLGVERRDLAARAVAAYRTLSDERELVRALRLYGDVLLFADALDESEIALMEGLEIGRRIGERRRLVVLLDALGAVRRLRGDLHGARVRQQEALDVSLARGGAASRYHAQALANLGELEFALGDVRRATELASEAREAFVRLGDGDHAANVLSNLAAYAIAEDRLDAAAALAREALAEVHGRHHPFTVAANLEHLAVIAGLSGDSERAATLLGFTEARFAALRLLRQPTECAGYDRLREALSARFESSDLQRRFAGGAALSEEAAIGLALERPGPLKIGRM